MSAQRTGFALGVLALTFSACGENSEDSSGSPAAAGSMGAAGSTMSTGVPCNAPFDAGGGWEACDQMLFHRKSAGTCPGTLPERSTRNDGINASQLEPGACTQDRHCTDGPNGYCQSNLCIYRCLQDSDCSDTQICFCVEQMCITASCSTDEDCGERLACEATQPDPDLPYQAACQTAQ